MAAGKRAREADGGIQRGRRLKRKRAAETQYSFSGSGWVAGDDKERIRISKRLRRVSVAKPSVKIANVVAISDDRETTIGRMKSCSLYLDSTIARGMISRRHAKLIPTSSGYHMLVDTSKNGCYVNGTRRQQVELVPGDIIVFGGPTNKEEGDFAKQMKTEFAFKYEPVDAQVPTCGDGICELEAMYDRYGGKHIEEIKLVEQTENIPSFPSIVTNNNGSTIITRPSRGEFKEPIVPQRRMPQITSSSLSEAGNGISPTFMERLMKTSEIIGAVTTLVGVIAVPFELLGPEIISSTKEFSASILNTVILEPMRYLLGPYCFPVLGFVMVLCIAFATLHFFRSHDEGTIVVENAPNYYPLLRRSESERLLRECRSRIAYILRPADSQFQKIPKATMYTVSLKRLGRHRPKISHTKMWKLHYGSKFYPNIGSSIIAPDLKKEGCPTVESFVFRYVCKDEKLEPCILPSCTR